MSNIEQYISTEAEDFDTLEPAANSWATIEAGLPRPPKHRFGRAAWLKVAAVFVLLCGAGTYLLHKEKYGLDTNQHFPNIVLHSPKGEALPISALKGKVVLVEFWASWSKVCTEEHCYYFQPIYEEYKDKGFEIYGISFDYNKDEWVKGIERDQLPWIQVSDLKGLDSPLTRKYEVNKLPTTFLLDEEGKIVMKNVNADELPGELDKLLARK